MKNSVIAIVGLAAVTLSTPITAHATDTTGPGTIANKVTAAVNALAAITSQAHANQIYGAVNNVITTNTPIRLAEIKANNNWHYNGQRVGSFDNLMARIARVETDNYRGYQLQRSTSNPNIVRLRLLKHDGQHGSWAYSYSGSIHDIFAQVAADEFLEGVKEGFDNGYRNGYSDGYRDGFIDGYAAGYAQGSCDNGGSCS